MNRPDFRVGAVGSRGTEAFSPSECRRARGPGMQGREATASAGPPNAEALDRAPEDLGARRNGQVGTPHRLRRLRRPGASLFRAEAAGSGRGREASAQAGGRASVVQEIGRTPGTAWRKPGRAGFAAARLEVLRARP